jgi:carboxymethylenebutenolidase
MSEATAVQVPVLDGLMPADLHLPESGRGPGLVLFQEIFGVGDYIDARARDLAARGYVVLVPHFYWRLPGGDEVVPSGELDRAMGLLQQFDWELGVADGAAALAHLQQRDEVDGPVGLIGFCFGGGLAFAVAAATATLGEGAPDALVSYYGSALPNLLGLAGQVDTPSLYHFGLDDTYIPADTVREIERALTEGWTDVTFRTYPGAGHAFDNPDPAFHHEGASQEAWAATTEWLEEKLPVGDPS